MPDDGADEYGDVFGLLGSDVRVAILRALWAERTASPDGPDPVSFSTLRDHVDVRDSGRFNYHLGKLVPEFVEEVDGGYDLTYAGKQVIGAIVSGTYTDAEATTMGPVVFGDCLHADCEGTAEMQYDSGRLVIECDTCDRPIVETNAPPIVVGAHDIESEPGAFADFFITRIQKLSRGFCTLCGGPVELSVARFHPEHEAVIEKGIDLVHECQECGTSGQVSAIATVLGHPAVVSLLHDAGIDYRDPWEHPELLHSVDREVSQDPIRVRLTVTLAGNSLTITLDENADVIECERG